MVRDVDKRKRSASVRAVERAAKRQCKTDERQTEALRAKMRNWAEHMFEAKCAISLRRARQRSWRSA